MLDLFATPLAGEPGTAAEPVEILPEKSLENEDGGGGTPKNFEEFGGNIDRVVGVSENHLTPCKEIQAPLPEPAKPSNDAPKGEYTRVSAMVKPPTEEALRDEGVLVEDEDDPRRTDKWSPRWSPRARNPNKRGWHANINAIHLLESKAQLPKPDVINWLEYSERKGIKSQRDLPWKEIEQDLLNFVASGGTVTAYCVASGLKRHEVLRHQATLPEFAAALADARRSGADALAAEALTIASTPMLTEERITVFDKNDEVVTKSVKLADNTYARKLAFQARMQLLEKWAPEKYGPNAKADVGSGMAEKLRQARARIRTSLRASKAAASASSSTSSGSTKHASKTPSPEA